MQHLFSKSHVRCFAALLHSVRHAAGELCCATWLRSSLVSAGVLSAFLLAAPCTLQQLCALIHLWFRLYTAQYCVYCAEPSTGCKPSRSWWGWVCGVHLMADVLSHVCMCELSVCTCGACLAPSSLSGIQAKGGRVYLICIWICFSRASSSCPCLLAAGPSWHEAAPLRFTQLLPAIRVCMWGQLSFSEWFTFHLCGVMCNGPYL